MNTTTRRHPRSLAEAFPDERAYCVEIHRRHWTREAVVYLGFVAFLICITVGAHWLAVHFGG